MIIMKKRLIQLLPLFLLASLFSCSGINGDDRFIETRIDTIPLRPEGDEMVFKQAVLVEEFTGQKCVNCPLAAEEVEKTVETYGESYVIQVAIHSPLKGLGSTTKFLTPISQTYWNAMCSGESSLPVARINRGALNREYLSWNTEVSKLVAKDCDVAMNMKTSFDEAANTTHIQVKMLSKSGKTAKMQLWLLENGIVAAQSYKGYDEPIKDFVHNHVLREAINGDWGEDVSIGTGTDTLMLEKDYVIPSAYVAKNCDVVAFVYNNNGVLQAKKTKISVSSVNSPSDFRSDNSR